MFANAIKGDVNVSPRKKIATLVSKPRTASIQEGEDDVRNNGFIVFSVQSTVGLLGATPCTEQKTRLTRYSDASILEHSRYDLPNVLQIGSFNFEIPPVEPEKDTVRPNFKTPPR